MSMKTAAVAVGLAVLMGASASSVGAQTGCQRNQTGACTTPTDATRSIYMTVPSASRVTLSTTTINLGSPTNVSYDAGLTTPVSFSFLIRANAAWSVAIKAGQANWTASGPIAWTSKPASDLQWATAVGGPYTDLTTSNATIASGAAATGTGSQTVFVRAKLSWLTDTPGTYSMPIDFVITAP